MKKTLLLLALCAGSLLSANAEDHLTALLKPGDAVLGIQLKNADAYTAFQMDIALPEGMTLVEADDAVTLQRQDTEAPQVVESNVVDGKLRVVAYSYKEDGTTKVGNKSFTDTKGDVLLLKVNVTEACVANAIELSNVEFVKTDGLTATALGVTAKGKFGDINGNNEVTTDDATMAIKHFLKKITLTSEQIELGDLSGDMDITTDDATRIIKVFLKKF